MMRRGFWLFTGTVLGAGGTIWAQRRLRDLSERVQSGQIPADIANIAQIGARAGAGRVRDALAAGRNSAREREGELWRAVEVRSLGR